MKPEALRNRRIWITGATHGIGRAVALKLASFGAKLALSAYPSYFEEDEFKHIEDIKKRKILAYEKTLHALNQLVDAINEKKPDSAIAIPCDVRKRQDNKKAIEEIYQKLGGLDIAILNAGVLRMIDIENSNDEIIDDVIDTNLKGEIYGAIAALPLLRQSRFPHLIAMSSLTAYGGLPDGHYLYSATKAGIRTFFEGLRIELASQNISVSIITPGFVETRLTDQNNFRMFELITPEEAAEAIINGIVKQQPEIYFPKVMSLNSWSLMMLPRKLYDWIMMQAFDIPYPKEDINRPFRKFMRALKHKAMDIGEFIINHPVRAAIVLGASLLTAITFTTAGALVSTMGVGIGLSLGIVGSITVGLLSYVVTGYFTTKGKYHQTHLQEPAPSASNVEIIANSTKTAPQDFSYRTTAQFSRLPTDNLRRREQPYRQPTSITEKSEDESRRPSPF